MWPRKILGLISNYDHPPHIYALLRQLGLEKFFRAIIISGEVGIKKPEPRIFRLALEKTGLQPNEAVYVGDTKEDMMGSVAAQLTPIFIRRSQSYQDAVALDKTDHRLIQAQQHPEDMPGIMTIASLSELIDILE